jgi:hypothetical protein
VGSRHDRLSALRGIGFFRSREFCHSPAARAGAKRELDDGRRETMASAFCTNLAKIAEEQHSKFHLIQEGDQPLRSQIKKYWQDLGLGFTSVSVPWSAVFVSWCVKKAGALPTEFKFAAAHSIFVHKAIQNATANTGVFRGVDAATARPAVGDIIQNNRGGTSFNFAHARANRNYQSHSAIVVETGIDALGSYALTIGGNESDSIRRVRVALTAAGVIKPRSTNPYICVIKTLK